MQAIDFFANIIFCFSDSDSQTTDNDDLVFSTVSSQSLQIQPRRLLWVCRQRLRVEVKLLANHRFFSKSTESDFFCCLFRWQICINTEFSHLIEECHVIQNYRPHEFDLFEDLTLTIIHVSDRGSFTLSYHKSPLNNFSLEIQHNVKDIQSNSKFKSQRQTLYIIKLVK